VPDEKWGEMVAAYVVSRNAALTASDLNKYCLSHPMLARYKRPRLYRFVADLPVKANGEKDRSRAKAEAARDLSAGLFRRP
jgi:acyl-CoA synthetase (AMP-forming)/AMP-acid ligase II